MLFPKLNDLKFGETSSRNVGWQLFVGITVPLLEAPLIYARTVGVAVLDLVKMWAYVVWRLHRPITTTVMVLLSSHARFILALLQPLANAIAGKLNLKQRLANPERAR